MSNQATNPTHGRPMCPSQVEPSHAGQGPLPNTRSRQEGHHGSPTAPTHSRWYCFDGLCPKMDGRQTLPVGTLRQPKREREPPSTINHQQHQQQHPRSSATNSSIASSLPACFPPVLNTAYPACTDVCMPTKLGLCLSHRKAP